MFAETVHSIASIIKPFQQLTFFDHTRLVNQKTLTIFMGVVALCYQHHNGVPQLPQTEFFLLTLGDVKLQV